MLSIIWKKDGVILMGEPNGFTRERTISPVLSPVIPCKLKSGDEIRIISPARSLYLINTFQRNIAQGNIQGLGLRLSFSRNAELHDEFMSSPIEARVDDLHVAFLDKNVKGILTTIGGFNSNQLLRYINYDIIRNNPKVLCGFSDITALSNAIYAKTGLVGYSGPHYSTFGMAKGCEYTVEYFNKCLMQQSEFEVVPPENWSDDEWYAEQEKRTFSLNTGPYTIKEGFARGTIIGGNLCTLNLLQGTEYMPSFDNTLLFIEDDSVTTPETFDRDLQSIIHQPNFNKVLGMVIGRFQNASKMTPNILRRIVAAKRELADIPVVADFDFGHTTPRFTFPIGGMATLDCRNGKVKLIINAH